MPASIAGQLVGRHHRPYVDCEVALPRLALAAALSLLIDTGADRTILHWWDRLLFADPAGSPLPDHATFAERRRTSGIGGAGIEYGVEEAELLFSADDGTLVRRVLPIDIALRPDPGLPSLLGRDVLASMRLELDIPRDDVRLIADE